MLITNNLKSIKHYKGTSYSKFMIKMSSPTNLDESSRNSTSLSLSESEKPVHITNSSIASSTHHLF